MNNPVPLIELIQQRLERGDVELPVFDGVAMEVHRETHENRLDADGLCQILEKDATLVTEVLRMANSSFFSGFGEVRSLREAAVRLGVRQIAAIVFSISQKRLYSASGELFRPRLVTLWQHASAVSTGARWTAIRAGYRALADEAFVAGLLHDVGKLSLLRIIEVLIKEDNLEINDVLVDMTLGNLHCSHAADLLAGWNLPESYRDVVKRLEDDVIGESDVVLATVRFVDKVCAVEGISDCPDPTLALETLPELAILGLNEIDVAELRLVIEDINGESGGQQQAA
jgi:HD-like signal output (HDOD) protein